MNISGIINNHYYMTTIWVKHLRPKQWNFKYNFMCIYIKLLKSIKSLLWIYIPKVWFVQYISCHPLFSLSYYYTIMWNTLSYSIPADLTNLKVLYSLFNATSHKLVIRKLLIFFFDCIHIDLNWNMHTFYFSFLHFSTFPSTD